MLARVAVLRQLIVDRLGENTHGFSSAVPSRARAGFSDRNQTQVQSCLYRCRYNGGQGFPAQIYLQFGATEVDGGMTATLLDRNFSRITLALFDAGILPDVDNRIADKNALAANLLREGGLRNNGKLYRVSNPVNFRQHVGHIIDLDLLSTPEAPAYVIREIVQPYDNDRMRTESSAFIEKVAAVLNDLLPVAERYVTNRTNMFSRVKRS